MLNVTTMTSVMTVVMMTTARLTLIMVMTVMATVTTVMTVMATVMTAACYAGYCSCVETTPWVCFF